MEGQPYKEISMPLTLDELKQKAAEAEEQEMNEPAEYPDPVEPEEDDEESEVNDPIRPEDANPEPEIDEDVDPDADPQDPAEPAEFSFDGKIKVMDSEVEVPEFLKNAVKDEESANYVKEMIEKSYGLDAIKEKRDHYKTQVGELEGKFNEVNQELNKTNENLDFLDNLIKTGDMQTFQQYAGINDEAILKRAAEIIQYRELTPTQKAEYDRNIQSRQRQYALEFENQELRQTHSNSEVQKTSDALDEQLSSSFSEVSSSYDKENGYGSFRKEVVKTAMAVEQRTGKSLSPQEAIELTVRSFGLPLSQAPQNPEPTQQPAPQVPVNERVVVREPKPTMTNVKAGNKSPVKPKVKSIADLRKLAAQFDH